MWKAKKKKSGCGIWSPLYIGVGRRGGDINKMSNGRESGLESQTLADSSEQDI